ncbi:MAG: type I restriction endonuclease subunit R, partial [Anaerolineae bacterium]|nr:type I restriction endonuclease subunit R [Anaerolineae bacterium]
MFNELNTVENYIRDLLCGQVPPSKSGVAEDPPPYLTIGRNSAGAGWHYVNALALPRRINDVFVEDYLRDALIRLNPAIAARPERADEVLYKLRAIVLTVRSEGLIRANEEFTAWLRGERSMPFGERNEHVTIHLLNYEDLDQNQYILSTQYTFRAGPAERRPDLVLLINGLPLVIIEAKTPVRHAVSWFDGAKQIHDDYERFTPELFAPNVFSVASDGKELRYGAIHTPLDKWSPWMLEEADTVPARAESDSTSPYQAQTTSAADRPPVGLGLSQLASTVPSLLRPNVILDILAHFSIFATDKQKRRHKIVCRYQQYEGGNLIVQRVLAGSPRKGLIWHFQGSGKSLLMVFAAQ